MYYNQVSAPPVRCTDYGGCPNPATDIVNLSGQYTFEGCKLGLLRNGQILFAGFFSVRGEGDIPVDYPTQLICTLIFSCCVP